MNKREWFVAGGATLFALPFVLAGGFILVIGLVKGEWFPAAFGAVFILVAIAGTVQKARAADYAVRAVTTAVKAPNELWRMRPDWAAGRTWKNGQPRNQNVFCTLDHVPIHPGDHLHGTLEWRRGSVPTSGFRFVVTAGKWHTEKVVRSSAAVRTESGWQMPFDFLLPKSVPANAPPYWSAMPWRLTVSVDGRVLFGSVGTFDLPVFAEPVKTAIPQEEAEDNQEALAAAAHRDVGASSGVRILTLPDGTLQISFKPNSPKAILPLAGFTAIFFAVALFGTMGHRLNCGLFVFWIVVLALIAFLIVAAVDSTTIRVKRDRVEHRLSGSPKWKTVFAKDIARVEANPGWSTSSGTQYDVLVIGHQDQIAYLGRGVQSKNDAEVIAARVWQALGHSL